MTPLVSFTYNDSEYRLTDKQAEEVDAKDAATPHTPEGDREFESWFRSFTKRHHLRPYNKSMARYWTGWKDSSSKDVILASTLRACKTVVDVLDPQANLAVSYYNGSTSAWREDEVYIPTDPVTNATSLYEAVDISSGFSMHEAVHSKRSRHLNTREIKEYIQGDKTGENGTLINLAEDVRMIPLELEESPGFEPHFRKTDDYVWGLVPRNFPTWEEADREKRINGIITGVNYPDREALDPSWAPAIEKVNAVIQQYGSDLDAIRASEAMKAIIHLDEPPQEEQPEDDGTGQPGDDDGDEQPGSGGAPEGSKKGKEPSLLPCEYMRKDTTMVSEEQATRVRELVEEEVEQLDSDDPAFGKGEGEHAPTMTVLKPKYRGGSPPRMDGLLSKAKAALEFRRAVPRADERLMRSGELDEDELYRLSMGDFRVFRDITEEVVPSAAVYLLVDLSGSMRSGLRAGADGSWMDKVTGAQAFATLLVKGMQSKPHVTVRVLAHTGDNESGRSWSSGDDYARGGSANFYRIWEEGDNFNRLAILEDIQNGENYDGYAITWAGRMLAEEEAEQKLLIVLSDGQPAGRSYGGSVGRQHVRRQVEWLERKGVDTVQIAIDSALDEREQREMFKHYVPVDRDDIYGATLRTLQRILTRLSQPK